MYQVKSGSYDMSRVIKSCSLLTSDFGLDSTSWLFSP